MSSDVRDDSSDAAGVLWDICVTADELQRRVDRACSGFQTRPGPSLCCSGWNHILSIWPPAEDGQDAVVILNQIQCGLDPTNFQPLSSTAQLKDGRWLRDVAFPRSSCSPCLSAGMQGFLTCHKQRVFVIAGVTDSSNKTGKPSQSHGAPDIAPDLAIERFNAPSEIVSAAAGAFHFAVSCSDGYQQFSSSAANVVLARLSQGQLYCPFRQRHCCHGIMYYALNMSRSVLCWGCNLKHQCSQESEPDLPFPTPVAPLQGLHIVAVAAGNSHTLALSDAGDVYAWGSNECGQLGIGTTGGGTRCAAKPQLIEHLGQDTAVVDIGCGTRHSVAVDASGNAMLWGWAEVGQLGQWEEHGQHLSASIDDLGISIDNGLHGVLLSQQEGHRALHVNAMKLSWAAVALQPRHYAHGSAPQMAAASEEAISTAVPSCGEAGQDPGNLRPSCGNPSPCQGSHVGVSEPVESGFKVSDTQSVWKDSVHGLCIAVPTELLLASSGDGSAKPRILSCHAAWWHTLLVLAPQCRPQR